MTHPVSTAKSSSLAGSTLHPAHCTVYITHCTCTWKCPWIWTCTLHTTSWTLYTAHHMFKVHFANLSLHTAGIQNLPKLVWRFTWWNVPWSIQSHVWTNLCMWRHFNWGRCLLIQVLTIQSPALGAAPAITKTELFWRHGPVPHLFPCSSIDWTTVFYIGLTNPL